MPLRQIQRGLGYADTSGIYVKSDPVTLINQQCGEGETISDVIDTMGASNIRCTVKSSANSGTSPTANVYLQTSTCGNIWRTANAFTQIGSTPYTAVTSAGTAPPTITLTGTPSFTGAVFCAPKCKIKVTTGGARGTWVGALSFDEGATYPFTFTSAATVTVRATTGGLDTGIVLNIATGSANVDNTWAFEVTSPQRVCLGSTDKYLRAAVVVGGSSTPTHTLLVDAEVMAG